MAVTVSPGAGAAASVAMSGGHGASQLSRSLERLLEEAALSGELRLSGRKLRELPRATRDLSDTVRADLSRNLLSEVPDEVTSFVYLERLVLAHNTLRALPDTLAALASLTYLDLRCNQLTELPREVCSLPLQILLVSHNRLSSLPRDLPRLTQLAELDASHNQLVSLPLAPPAAAPAAPVLACLRCLRLQHNRLPLLPVQVTQLQLEVLDISCNYISSLPLELRQMTSLVTLRLDNNPLVSPPTIVCMKGRVHIFQYLESLESKESGRGARGEEARRGARGQLAAHRLGELADVSSDYATDSTLCSGRSTPASSTPSTPATPTLSARSCGVTPVSSAPRVSPPAAAPAAAAPLPPADDKAEQTPPLQQTYRQYKEALRQQRQQDVYRPRGSPSSPSPDSSPQSAAHSPLLNGHSARPPAPSDDPRRPVQKVVPSRNVSRAPLNGHAESNGKRASPPWSREAALTAELSFTMKRELDKHKEEADLLQQLRTILEMRLKMSLPEKLAPVLADGVVLCHLVNHVRPRAVASVHVPSVAQPKLTMARCRRNVDNFLEACRKIGVDEKLMCCAADVLEGRGTVQVAITVTELLRRAPRPHHTTPTNTHSNRLPHTLST